MTCDESLSTFEVSSSSFLVGGSKHSTFRGGSTTSLVWCYGDKRPFSSIFSSDVDDVPSHPFSFFETRLDRSQELPDFYINFSPPCLLLLWASKFLCWNWL